MKKLSNKIFFNLSYFSPLLTNIFINHIYKKGLLNNSKNNGFIKCTSIQYYIFHQLPYSYTYYLYFGEIFLTKKINKNLLAIP